MNLRPDNGDDSELYQSTPGSRRIHLSPPPAYNQSQPTHVEDDDELNLSNLFRQLLVRKWLILTFVFLGILGGAFYGQLAPDSFRAQSVIQIEQRSSGAGLPSELIGELFIEAKGGVRSEIATELGIIKSRLVLDPVVEQLGLDYRVTPRRAPWIGFLMQRRSLPIIDGWIPAQYARPNESITIETIAIADKNIGKQFELEILGDERFRLTALEDLSSSAGSQRMAPVEGVVGETVKLGEEIEVRIAAIDAPEGRKFDLIRFPIHVIASRLSNNLTATDRRSSEIVDLRYTGGDRQEVQVIVNAIFASYRNQNLLRRSAEIDQTIQFIEAQLPDLQAAANKAVAELAAYRKDVQDEELSLGTQALLERAVRIEASLRELEFREEMLATRLTDDNPDMISLRTGKAQLQTQLREVRALLADVPEAEQELLKLTERAERAQETLIQTQNRIEQLRILKASTVANIRVLEQAESAALIGPSRTRPIILAMIIAFLAAVAVVLGRNTLGRGIEDARAVEALGLSLYATINKIKALDKARAGQPIYSLALSHPQNMAIESLRGLRTGLQFSLAAADSRTLMMTSCAPSEGKSFVSLNLALVSAQGDNRVLLVDCDLRRGELSKAFGLTRKAPGLSDFLAGSAEFGAIVTKDPDTGLEFIGTGSYPPNPSELLSTKRFSRLMHDLKEHYDLIILDAPPALAVTDPGIIGQSAGITLLVATHLKTTQFEIQAAQKSLSVSGVSISGVIINSFDEKRSRYGSYGSKYGYYHGGYSYKYK